MRGPLVVVILVGALAIGVAWVLADPEPVTASLSGPGAAEQTAPLSRVDALLTRPRNARPSPSESAATTDASPPFVARVLDALTDDPVAGATVAAGVEDSAGWTVLRTDAEGFIELPGVAQLEVSFRVEAEGYVAAAFDSALTQPARSAPRRIRLQPAAELRVKVSDPLGLPLEDVRVHVVTKPDSDPPDAAYTRELEPVGGSYMWTADTDALGVARFVDVPAAIPIKIGAGPGAKYLALQPGVNESVFEIDLGLQLVGRVLDQHGQVVDRAQVGLERDVDGEPFGLGSVEFATTRQGAFQYTHLEVGDYWLRSESDELPAQPLFVRVSGEQPRQAVTFHVWRGVSIAGVIVDPEGVPVATQITVGKVESARNTHGRRPPPAHEWIGWDEEHVRSGSDGTFEFHGLLPGKYRLRAGEYSHPVEAHTGEFDVRLHMGTPQVLRGTVTGASETASLHIARPDDRFMTQSRYPMGEEGEFAVLLEPGAYALFVAEGRDVALHTGVIDAYEKPSPLDLTLSAGAEVVVRNDSDTLFHWEIRHEGCALRNGTLGPGDRETPLVPVVALDFRTRRAGEHELEQRSFFPPATLHVSD